MILRSAESCSLLWSYVSLLPLSSCSSLSLFITLSIVIFCVQVFNHFLFPTTSDVLQTSPPPFFFSSLLLSAYISSSFLQLSDRLVHSFYLLASLLIQFLIFVCLFVSFVFSFFPCSVKHYLRLAVSPTTREFIISV